MSVVVMLFFTPSAYAEIFSWKDSNGTSYVTDDISKVPPEYRKQALANKMSDLENEEPAGEQRMTQPSTGYKKRKSVEKKEPGVEYTDKDGRGEEYWRSRAESLRIQLQDLQEEYDDLCRQERGCEERQPAPYLGSRRQDCKSIYRDSKLRIQQTIEETRRSLEVDLPDEARRHGALPGWLR